jgi:hypothetical protein
VKRSQPARLAIAGLLVAGPPVSAQDQTLIVPSAGHDGGFYLDSGDLRLDVSGYLQIRWQGASLESGAPDEPTWNSGFEIRRARVTFDGELYDGAIGFRISNSFNRNGGEDSLSDGFITLALRDDLTLRLGQFKLPLLREELTSAKRLLAADRSLTNATFTLSRSQAVELSYESDRITAALALSDGVDNVNTSAYETDSDLALTGRVEYLVSGAFRQFRGFSGFPGTDPGWLLGAAVNTEWTGDTPQSPSEEVVAWTVDSVWQGDGWSAFVAYIGRYASDGDDGSAATDMGVVAQASRFFGETTELFTRYDAVIPDKSREGDSVFNCVTVGFNRYLHGHSAKFTTDVQWFPDAADDNDLVSSQSGVGYIDSGPTRNEVVIRAQFQIVF